MLLSIVLISSVIIAISSPVMADEDTDIEISISPTTSIHDSIVPYEGTMRITGDRGINYYNFEVIIPKRYTVLFPSRGKIIGTYTMTDLRGHDKVEIIIYSNDSRHDLVDVKYTTNDGDSWRTVEGQNINHMTIGSTKLKLKKPTSSNPGSLKIDLGSLGPISRGNIVKFEMEKNTLRNPSITGTYTWYVNAQAGPIESSDHVDVRIR